MYEENENFMISIPANVKVGVEIIDGIGMKELIYTVVAGIISAIVAYSLFGLFGNYMLSIGIFLGVTALTFVCVMKDKNNTSIADTIKNIFVFFSHQRFYKFVIKEEDL